jgi:hypothetical protein
MIRTALLLVRDLLHFVALTWYRTRALLPRPYSCASNWRSMSSGTLSRDA